MKTIYKYPIEIQSEQAIELPAYTEPLTVQLQGDVPCLWAIVDTEEKKVPCKVYVIGTGHPVPKGIDANHHVGTIQFPGLVFHVFVARAYP